MFTYVDTRKSAAWWGRSSKAIVRIGSFSISIELRIAGSHLMEEISDLYACYARESTDELPDFAIVLRRPNLWRTFYRPQIQASVGDNTPFLPMAQHFTFPILESCLNWAIAVYTTRFLLFHAAVVERDRKAIIMPGESGSGKSTLCAALISRGWRLLSDEFAMVRPSDGRLQPHPRPISLKNESISMIAKMMPDAHFSKLYENTPKGTVAYMRAPCEAIEQAEQTAKPALVVFPRHDPGARTELKPLEKAQAFMDLIDQSSNYFTMLGIGFETLANLVETCNHYTLSYSALDDAISLIEDLNLVPQGIEHVG